MQKKPPRCLEAITYPLPQMDPMSIAYQLRGYIAVRDPRAVILLQAIYQLPRPVRLKLLNSAGGFAEEQCLLNVAVESDQAALVKQLLVARADPDGPSYDCKRLPYWAPLMLAARRDASISITHLLQARANVNITYAYKRYNTPLFQAVIFGKPSTVSQLIAAGACVNRVDSYGFAPLCRAIHKCKAHTVQVLLEAKANITDCEAMSSSNALTLANKSSDPNIRQQVCQAAQTTIQPVLNRDLPMLHMLYAEVLAAIGPAVPTDLSNRASP